MSDLERLFYWRGIAPDFYTFRGELTQVPIENRIKILEAMGVDCSSDSSIAREAFDLDIKPWLSWLPPLEVVPAGSAFIDINFPPSQLAETLTWCLIESDHRVVEGSFKPRDLEEVGDYSHEGLRYSRRRLQLGELQPNYYRINLQLGDRLEETELAIVPAQAFQPAWSADEHVNPFGFVVQLYTLRSERNWGIGDFSDLKKLIQESAQRQIDVIGLNPFHALQADLRENFSPYSPSDRQFLNALYIDVEAVEYYRSDMVDFGRVAKLRNLDYVDYHAVRELKFSVLYQCFTQFLVGDCAQLKSYIAQKGQSLADFASYEAMNSWRAPGLAVATADLDELIAALETAPDLQQSLHMVVFYAYLQWLTEQQLAACYEECVRRGMKVGIVRDLAVGASGGGAEVSANSALFCRDASVGAPPDPLALTGQNWGIPPMDPAELRRTAFNHFRALLRANMAHCGALRIDHAMSLYRLWWCPPGATADKGAYIYYPFKEMLGLLCLESHLAQCMIIAEDLGIVPDEFRDAVSRTGMYSNRVFYFEKWQDFEFKHPRDYERQALAMLDNHDVPTLRSWWDGTDLVLRGRLNLLEANSRIEAVLEHRQIEKRHLIEMMYADNLVPPSWQDRDLSAPADEDIVFAIIRFASAARSRFFILQLEDLLLMDAPVNVPGTFREHPNWQRKLSADLVEIFSNVRIEALMSDISAKRNPN